MLLNLKTGRVTGYTEGQAPLIYLVSSVEAIRAAGCAFVFTDGHGLATFTSWFDDIEQLSKVDWGIVGKKYWADEPEDNDRQRRKQAEFLVHGSCDWSLISDIAVVDEAARQGVEAILAQFPDAHKPTVAVRRNWYY